MEVILIQDVDNLGSAHEKVSVKHGYARNYLIPRKLAVEANPSNLKQLDERVKQLQKKEAKLMAGGEQGYRSAQILSVESRRQNRHQRKDLRQRHLRPARPLSITTEKAMRSIAAGSTFWMK